MKRYVKWLLPVAVVSTLGAYSAWHPSTTNDPFNDPFFQDPFGDEIFKEMMQMQRKMDEMFRRMQTRISQRQMHMAMPLLQHGWGMQSGFVDKGDHYELQTSIPQNKDNSVNIRTQNGMIDISARIVHEEKRNTNGYVSTARSEQMYRQTLSLPQDADENDIKTEFRNGMLVVLIGKKPQAVKKIVAPKASAPKITIQTPKTTLQSGTQSATKETNASK